MNPARDYRYFLRRPSQRPDSGVRRAFSEPDEGAAISEPGCSRPTRCADADPELVAEETVLLGTFQPTFSEEAYLPLEEAGDIDDLVEMFDDVVSAHAAPEPPAAEKLMAELVQARAAIEDLSAQLAEEREVREALEGTVEALKREQEVLRSEEEAQCQRKLQHMSDSYHDTLGALRRAYEQRIQRAAAVS